MRRFALSLGPIVILAGHAGCSPRAATPPPATIAAPAPAPRCARLSPGVGAARAFPTGGSSPVTLARTPDGELLAYVADADEPTLRTIDVETGKEIAVTTLASYPEQALVLADGRVAVTLRGASQVQVLEPTAKADAPLASRCVADVPTEPFALAESGDTLLVTSGWAHTLSVLSSSDLTSRRTIDLPREPRAIVVSDDGQRAFVSHVVDAKLSIVELSGPTTDGGKPRELSLALGKVTTAGLTGSARLGCQGYALAKSIDVPKDGEAQAAPPAPRVEQPLVIPGPRPPGGPPSRPAPPPITPAPGRVFAPMVTVDPGEANRVAYYGSSDGLSTEEPQVSVIDERAERVLTKTALATKRTRSSVAGECVLPRSAAYLGGALYVTCLGIDAVVELDGRAADPARAERGRFRVPAGPTGIAIDPVGRRAIVWSQFDRVATIVSLDNDQARSTVLVSRKAGEGLGGELARGRVLYHQSGDARISAEGLSCASCHPDGRDDAITWGTADGPRNTPMLGSRLEDSAPYSWNGNHATLDIHLRDTLSRLRGTGLPDEERQALLAYVRTLRAPAEHPQVATEARRKLIEDGKALFHASETACASCHDPDRSFADGQAHDVTPQGSGGKKLDTPSLRFVARTAPYFHDGRYPTLDAMLQGSDHAMGKTVHLSRTERAALVAYLETL